MSAKVKAYATAIAMAAGFAGMLNVTYAMPEFLALATPGIVFGLMAAGNTPANNNGLIYLGNFLAYSIFFILIAEVFLAVQRRRTR